MLTIKEIKGLKAMFHQLKGEHRNFNYAMNFLIEKVISDNKFAFELAYLYDKNYQSDGDFSRVTDPIRMTYEEYSIAFNDHFKSAPLFNQLLPHNKKSCFRNYLELLFYKGTRPIVLWYPAAYNDLASLHKFTKDSIDASNIAYSDYEEPNLYILTDGAGYDAPESYLQNNPANKIIRKEKLENLILPINFNYFLNTRDWRTETLNEAYFYETLIHGRKYNFIYLTTENSAFLKLLLDLNMHVDYIYVNNWGMGNPTYGHYLDYTLNALNLKALIKNASVHGDKICDLNHITINETIANDWRQRHILNNIEIMQNLNLESTSRPEVKELGSINRDYWYKVIR
jgi:hypothetical protein